MIVGIDLGTTNSLISYFTEEGPKIIPNRLGKHLTPSVVSIDEEGQVYVGEMAKERLLLYPETSASVFKRSMGSDKPFEMGKETLKAEELSSFVLKSLKEDAEAYLGEPITEAVISVPAYFNDQRRKATIRAGELAGLKVERLMSEPTAAAVAYGLYQNKEDSKFLVFDLGGGTFDVSIIELFGSILEVHAVAGDNFLGGEDFTEIIVKRFIEENHLEVSDLDAKTLSHIRKQADLCKMAFSEVNLVTMTCQINHEKVQMDLSIDDYEKACQPLFDRIKEPIKKSLADAKIKTSQIDQVVLIGGGSKLPLVRKFTSKLFKKLPRTDINPDEAVALGAAIQGAMKERHKDIKEVILTDVCPFTLGTEVVRKIDENRYREGYYCPIIERNTVIPTSRTERLYTVSDNQTMIRIKVLQGESRFAENNLMLGELEVSVPKGEAGKESVDVTYTYDINSILEVQVEVNSTGESIKAIIKGQNVNMTDEEIEQRMAELAYLKIHPKDQEVNKLLLLRGERVYEELMGEKRRKVAFELEKFDESLHSRDKAKIEAARERLSKVLEEMDESYLY